MVNDRRQGKSKSSGWDVLNVGLFGGGQEAAAHVETKMEWKTSSKITDLNTAISVITLRVKTPITTQR